MTKVMQSYIDALKAQTEVITQDVKMPVVAKVQPLTAQIEELMRSLPPAQRDRTWSVLELVPRLQGRYRDRPHAADVGQALRALGWVRVRDWTLAGGGRRVWRHGDSSTKSEGSSQRGRPRDREAADATKRRPANA